MTRIAFVGPLAGSFAEAVRAKVDIPCEIILSDETGILSEMPDVDVVVTLVFTREMGERSARLRLVQVPGAGLDRIDRTAIPAGAFLANVYGHETGIAEYIFGAMLALSRGFPTAGQRVAARRLAKPMGRGNSDASALAGTSRKNPGDFGLRTDRSGIGQTCASLRHGRSLRYAVMFPMPMRMP